jgi:tripartite-type tricarboxylate transporter receptor subunit TctC
VRLLRRNQLAGAVALPVASRIPRAQTHPMRHITIVVPFAPGGTLDALARIIVMVLTACLGGAEAPASAQTYPSRPITVIVPYAAGGEPT